jgi:hypothetical protein
MQRLLGASGEKWALTRDAAGDGPPHGPGGRNRTDEPSPYFHEGNQPGRPSR